MLYWIFRQLAEVDSFFNVFGYITLRTILAALTAMLLSLLLGPWFIRALERNQLGQPIRELGPQSHQAKAGTPTMGGLIVLTSIIVPVLLWGALTQMSPALPLPLDLKQIPNSKFLLPQHVHKYPDGRVDGIGAVSWYITLVSNTNEFKTAPTSWADMWQPEKKNKLGLLALASNSFLLEITAKTFFGGDDVLNSKEGILKVLNKLAEVKPNVNLWYRDEGQFQQALQSGEIPMGQYYHDVAGLAAADGHPVRSTFPKEGGVLDSGSWAVSKATKMSKEAHIFINYMCQPQIQAKLSRKVGTAPTVRQDVTDLTAAEFSAVSSDIPPIIPRYDLYTGELSDWVNQKWTEMVTE